MSNRYKVYLINLIFPALIFGTITGVLTALTISFYKFCAKYIIAFSENGYHYVRDNPWLIPIIILGLFAIAFLCDYAYKRNPDISGGGIPASIGILKGILSFNWLKTLLGTFISSLVTFLIGVPLGNEGPSVLMGTAVGRGVISPFLKKHNDWDKFSITAGACTGFSVATGAPVAGIVFAIEEVRQRISPIIILASSTSVIWGYITNRILAPILNVNIALFPEMQTLVLTVKDIWLPIVIGIAVGIFSVLFLKFYILINKFFNNTLKKISSKYKIFIIYLLTFLFGIYSYSFISTGHELILSLTQSSAPIIVLFLILIVRSFLTVSANSNSITGGMFVPLLALGAVLSVIIGEIIGAFFINSNEYYTVILALGITACIAGMMKMPLTAIVFSLEAFSLYKNIFSVILVVLVSYIITEISGVKSINDYVLDKRIKNQNEEKTEK